MVFAYYLPDDPGIRQHHYYKLLSFNIVAFHENPGYKNSYRA